MDFEAIKKAAEGYKPAMVKFLRDMIAIPSESCEEEGVVKRIAEELKKLAEQYQMELDKVKAAVDTAAVKSDLMGKKAAKIITDNAVAVAPTEEKKDDAETSEKE